MKTETVKIKHVDGYAIINECDFKEGTHVRFEQAETKVKAKTKAKAKKAVAK